MAHERIHTDENPYSCSKCDDTFEAIDMLRDHEKIHGNEQPFSCNMSNKSFTLQTELLKHQTDHVREQAFSCDKCNKKFRVEADFKKHQDGLNNECDPLEPLRKKYKDSDLQFSFKTVEVEDVTQIIKDLKKKTSCSFDEISAELLKLGVNELAIPLTHIINTSIQTSKFPSQWKQSKVCPIYKKGDRKLLKNYRPVSLLSVPGMVQERCIGIQMEAYLEENEILQDFQFGFRRGKSCISELLTLFNKLMKVKEQGKDMHEECKRS